MMKFNFLNKPIYAILALVLLFSSCEDDGEVSRVTTKVLVFHEGGFSKNNATIGNYDQINQEYEALSYKNANGTFIGDVQQSAIKNEGKIFSVLNGSNLVKAFDAETMLETEVISNINIDKPRYMAIAGNTAFLSNWGPYDENYNLTDSNILEIDLQNGEVTNIIETGEYVENVFIQNDKLLVSRAKWDGSIKNLTVINISSKEVIADFELDEGPAEILADDDGKVWVVCNSGKLMGLNAGLTASNITVDLEGAVLGDIDLYQNEIYFYQKSTNSVKKYNINNSVIENVISDVTLEIPYALGVDPSSGEIYLADGVDYAGEGRFIHYSADGEVINEVAESGILPSQFIFN